MNMESQRDRLIAKQEDIEERIRVVREACGVNEHYVHAQYGTANQAEAEIAMEDAQRALELISGYLSSLHPAVFSDLISALNEAIKEPLDTENKAAIETAIAILSPSKSDNTL